MRRLTSFLRTALLSGGMIALPAAALAVCVAVVNLAIGVNGIVVSTNVPAAPGKCQGDPGWAGVAAQAFVQIAGTPQGDPAKKPTLFLAGLGSPVNTFYLGVHAPFDPDLRNLDRLTLYFDANNSNTLNVGDFALVYEIGKLTPIVSEESCDSIPNQVQIYHYTGSDWGSPTLSPAGITSKFAFDYNSEAPDPEALLWELEISIDVATLGLAPGGFKMGAKLYPHEFAGSDTWTTWIWPTGLTAEGDPTFYFPGDGAVTPATMAPVSFAGCADVIIDAISATDPTGANNKFRQPQPGDWVAGTLPANLRNNFSASVRFFNPSDPMDANPVAVPNTGSVEFSIHPWGGGDFIGSGRVMRNEATSFTQLAQVRAISFQWPVLQADFTPIENDMRASQHSCLTVRLNGFLVNLNPAADHQDRNLTYTTLSTRVDTFLISTKGQFRESTQPMEFVMRTRWNNLPAKFATGWKYQILNADSLGLKDVGDGYYRFQMGAFQDRKVILEMTGGTMPPIKSQEYTLDARAGGAVADSTDGTPPLRIAVTPGQMVTVIAQGRVRVLQDTVYNGANGRSNREYVNQRFLLGTGAYAPYQHIGAIIGSFDGFRRAFVVGADKSFIVPAGATELALGVNDIVGQYKDNSAGPFTLHVFIGDPHTLPTQTAVPGNPKLGLPAIAEPGAGLPRLDIDVFRAVPIKPRAGQQLPPDARWLLPHTYVAYAVYHTDERGGGGGEKPPLGCGSKSAAGTSLFLGSSALGIVLLRRKRRKARLDPCDPA